MIEHEGEIFPPAWCAGICTNSMNDLCIEECAVKRDCSHFELKRNLRLEDMPKFPLRNTQLMTREEKFAVLAAYLSKVVDRLQGAREEPDQATFLVYQSPPSPSVDRGKVPQNIIAQLPVLQNEVMKLNADEASPQPAGTSSDPRLGPTENTGK